MTALSHHFLSTPIAHRGLHDKSAGRPENSMAAILAAVDAGYCIEVDIQRSKDGQAIVFHDYDLGRLTPEKGSIHLRTADELTKIQLCDSMETIPTLGQVLDAISGRVPLLIEVKDQDGAMGPNTGQLEQAIARDLIDYQGDVAVMSFNPHSVALLAKLLPDVPRGLVTGSFMEENWGLLPQKIRDELREIPDYETVDASFISHRIDDLNRPRVGELKAIGTAVLCWTVRDEVAEATARVVADNITFEGYMPKHWSA